MTTRDSASRRAPLVAALVVAAAGMPSAQQSTQGAGSPQAPAAAQPAQPVFRSGVETLPLDVTVINGQGEPIRDLIASDFTVRLDGRARRVLSAQWVPAASEVRSTNAAPPLPDGYVSNEQSAGGRLIVLVIDQPNILFGEMRPIRDAVEAFIDRLAAADRVALVGFGTGARSTSFISDHDQLKKALALLPGQQQQIAAGSGSHDLGIAAALAIDRGDEVTLAQVVMRDCAGSQRAIALCREEIKAEANQIAADARVNSDTTMRSLRDVLTNLKAVDAPKTLMLVSQGFLSDTQRDDVTRLTDLGALAATARTSIYAFRLESNPNDVTRARGTVSPLLIAEERRERRAGLETLTGAARGALFDITGTGTSVFQRVTSEISGYYLLGVEPDNRDQDGKPHPIRVDVARAGATVRAHRTMQLGGDAGATAAQARTPRDAVTAALSSPLPAASLPLRAIAFAFRGLNAGKVRLLVHADIGSAYTGPQRLAVGYYVVDKEGRTLDGQVSEVRLSPPAAGIPSPVTFSGGASVDPGDYVIKIAAVDGDRIGSLDLPVHASLLDLGKVQLTELIAGGPVPPVNLLRPTVGTQVSFGSVHGYLEAYGPDAAELGVRFEIAAEERGPAILADDVRGQIVGDERVIFSHALLVQALPPGAYRLRAIVRQGNALLTTLGRAFEVVGEAAIKTTSATGTRAVAPSTPLYLPVEQTDLSRPFNRDDALKPATLQLFETRVPAASKAAFTAGVAQLQKRDYKEAEASFKRAVQPDADSSSSLAYLGVTYAAAGRDEQATSVWRTSLAGADDVPEVYVWLGDALLRLKSLGEARPIIEEAAERWPMDARFARPLAMLYASFGKGVDAVRLLDQTLRDNQADQTALFKCVEWIFNAHRAGFVIHDRAEDRRLAHLYADRYLKAGGLNEPLIKQWLGYLDKEPPQ
jgi:VWFA-related protein